ncbi:Cysteine-rich receptor-like protein kinase 40 [Triticum urartu]|uniref:Cysteine-rich receptor-like protein kinase 40 n=1 Tax=Triticum urartu TaxID=4572 RepID=M8A8K6_TRIUA|nr:Cysteine-rich receptor-like protein kinase 40 [Triticum urartu]
MATYAGGANTENNQTVLSTLPKELPLDFLRTITDQFSDHRILGTGAFGTVYTGVMPDSQRIAMKKLAESAPVARDKAFTNEVQNIMALHHKNVMFMKAYSATNIYLWEAFRRTFLPQNILLDNNMIPKIADFGLSRLFGQEQTRANTQNVVGSYGYIAPEYLYRGEISAQSDIYSLGLLIIETTTGEKNNPKQNEPSAREFIERVRQNWTEGHIASRYSKLNANGLQEVKLGDVPRTLDPVEAEGEFHQHDGVMRVMMKLPTQDFA